MDASGNWTARNLNTELAVGGLITASLCVLTGADGFSSLVGLDASGDMLRFYQNGLGGPGAWSWGFANVGADQLRARGLPMPAFAGQLVPYATPWGGLHVAGLDAEGRIWSVWWAPGMDFWQSTNLSETTHAPVLRGALTAFVTPWSTIHVAGLDAAGHLQVTWWAPGFAGTWRINDLTHETNGPELTSLSSYVASWGGLNIVGLTVGEERISQYWWSPERTAIGWGVTPLESLVPALPARPRRIIGAAVPGFEAPVASLNVFAALEDSRVVRLFFTPGSSWQLENLSELSGPVR